MELIRKKALAPARMPLASRFSLVLAVLLSSWSVYGQTRPIAPSGTSDLKKMPSLSHAEEPKATQASAATGQGEQIQTRAESMMYTKEKGLIEAKGNVLVKKGNQELQADFVIVNTISEEADAYGNVVMKRGAEVWRGDRLHYNFKLGIGDADAMSYSAAPFKLKATKVERIAGNRIRAKSARVTTCLNEFEDAHFQIRAREITIDPGKTITGKNTVFYFGHVPFFYLPYWFRDLNEDTGWRFRAGYESKWGGYLLSSYRYPMGDVLQGETHADYRSKRGFALGQDFGWGTEQSQGAVELYYINDDQPLDDDDSPDRDIDSSRYSLKVKNTTQLYERDSIYLQAEYVSDIDLREDFFESEFRASSQPDNYLIYTHRDDNYAVDVLARMRLNEFYEGVNRMPEASLNVLRQPLGDTLLYYESQTYFSNLERVYSDASSKEDYSALRIDTAHMINYPGNYFGYLTVIPRIGARGTYYSATRQSSTADILTPITITNTVTGVTSSGGIRTNSVTTVSDGPADFRTRFEIGCETSFKAYRTWGGAAAPRRHVVEPYVNYTFVPEPSVLPDELYRFDSVDTLTKDHFIRLGVRNKYQRKIDDVPFDVIDLNLYTILLMDPLEGQDVLSNFYFDGRLQPAISSIITFDGYYDTTASELARFNARVEYGLEKWWQIGAEYHYVVNQSSLLSADVTFLPDSTWTWNIFGRYEAEGGRIEEEGGYIQRNLDCMSIVTRLSILPGYTKSDGAEVDNEVRVMFEFWLKAFPEMRLSARKRGQ